MSLLEQLARELAAAGGGGGWGLGYRDLPSGTPDPPMMHGPQGLFGVQGASRELVSTHVSGPSLASVLPAVGTDVIYPYFGFITGFTDEEGVEREAGCDDPPMAGALKNCYTTAQFGLVARETRELNVERVGELINRGEFTDHMIVNSPLMRLIENITPNVPGMPNLRREVLVRMMALGVAFQRKLAPLVYLGDPANNLGSAGNEGYMEWPGLDILIAVNHVDAFTSGTCPSLDSKIYDFTDTKVDDSGGDTIINLLVSMMRYLRHLAEGTGMDPVKWVIVMRPQLFDEITAIWPCSYLTYRCEFRSTAGDMHVNVSASDQIAMRDAMRRGRYLLIDSIEYEVVLDAYIPERNAGDDVDIDDGCFSSDIYIIPMTVAGNFQSTYWEYYNYAAGPMQAVEDARLGSFFWTDGGRFWWHAKPPNNSCIQHMATIRPRIILRTPHLAARIQNVQYCPFFHDRDVLPSDSFFTNGGETERSFAQPFSTWNPSV